MPDRELADTLGVMLIITWLILFLLVVASLYLPFVHYYYWQGIWRWLALLPLVLPLGYVASQVLQMLADEPDHSVSGPLAVGLVIISLVLSLGLRLWYSRHKHKRLESGQ